MFARVRARMHSCVRCTVCESGINGEAERKTGRDRDIKRGKERMREVCVSICLRERERVRVRERVCISNLARFAHSMKEIVLDWIHLFFRFDSTEGDFTESLPS